MTPRKADPETAGAPAPAAPQGTKGARWVRCDPCGVAFPVPLDMARGTAKCPTCGWQEGKPQRGVLCAACGASYAVPGDLPKGQATCQCGQAEAL